MFCTAVCVCSFGWVVIRCKLPLARSWHGKALGVTLPSSPRSERFAWFAQRARGLLCLVLSGHILSGELLGHNSICTRRLVLSLFLSTQAGPALCASCRCNTSVEAPTADLLTYTEICYHKGEEASDSNHEVLDLILSPPEFCVWAVRFVRHACVRIENVIIIEWLPPPMFF